MPSSFTEQEPPPSPSPGPAQLKIAVVGSGLAGLSTAHLLSSLVDHNGQKVDVQLFEKHDKLEYCPNLLQLYRSLNINIQPIDNTISCFNVQLDSASGTGSPPYLSSRTYKASEDYTVSLPDMAPFSIWNPFYFVRRLRRYTRIARDYARILVVSKEFLAKGQIADIGKHPIEWRNGRLITLREFLEAGGYSVEFCEFFVPLVASTCSCSFDSMMEYPACVVLEYVARCMPFGRMQSVLVGEQEVAARLAANIGTIHYNTTIDRVAETQDGSLVLVDSYGTDRTFDHVIFATQSGQAASILARFSSQPPVPVLRVSSSSDAELSDSSEDKEQITPTARDILEDERLASHPFYRHIKSLLRFPYERVQVVSHSDLSFLPKDPSYWRQLNIAKVKDADVMACPLKRWSKELEQEFVSNAQRSYRRRTSIFSLRPITKLRSRKNSTSSGHHHERRPFFSPTPTNSEPTPTTTHLSGSVPLASSSVMTTQIVNRFASVSVENSTILQTTNPLFPPQPDSIISSVWREYAVVNVESAKALDELHDLMDQQVYNSASPRGSQASQRVWFVGSYASPGIPSFESCVSSAVHVIDRIVDAESKHRPLTASRGSAARSFLKKRSLQREQQAADRSRTRGHRRTPSKLHSASAARSATMLYFQTAWRDVVKSETSAARHGRVSWSSVENIGVAVSRPLIYGNSATPLNGKKGNDPDHTHRWTVSVRGINNEDISYFVRRVTFKLHETYDTPQRTIDKPPFEVTETGWGEFDILIKIHFQAVSGEKALSLYHHLKLHPYEEDLINNPGLKTNTVTSYLYDEV
ncbi:NuA4 histone H4 acetyltransferase complex and the SWR1 complex subunit, partial [Podila epigama]